MIKFCVGIQARALSKRLPNKNFFNLQGISLCEWSINQAKVYFPSSDIFLLIPNDNYSVIFEEICDKNNIFCIKGNESDVLSRYEKLAVISKYDFIVRWTGDNPIKCKFAMDKLIRNSSQDIDYICYKGLRKTAVEIVSRLILKKIRLSNSYTNKCNEHVTYGIRNSKFFKNIILDPEEGWIKRKNDQLLTVDTINDFSRVNNFLKNNNIKPMMKNILFNEQFQKI